MGEKQQKNFIFTILFLFLYGQVGICQTQKQKHFVLVHGACHGAWCWYKLQPLLEAAGHNVTVLDLAASGIDPRSLDDLRTFPDYTQPLFEVMESIPSGEQVVLVGHSLGGINLAFAMERYPEKIFVAIFIGALLPDTVHRPSYVIEAFFNVTPPGFFLDTINGTFDDNLTYILFGRKYLKIRLYNLSPPEDVALVYTLARRSSFFLPDLQSRDPFTNERFGSVERAFIITGQDRSQTQEFQRWQINNTGVTIVKVIDSDHMAMISRPKTLCKYLLDIANQIDLKYSSL